MAQLPYELAKELKDAGFPQDGKNCQTLQSERGELCGRQYTNYEEAREKHDKECGDWDCKKTIQNTDVYDPTLSELIEACGDGFERLDRMRDEAWGVIGYTSEHDELTDIQKTPKEAVARLWLARNVKPEHSDA